MKITANTLWSDFSVFATEERLAQLREHISDCAFFDFWSMTVGDFYVMINKGMPKPFIEEIEKKSKKVLGIKIPCKNKLTVFEYVKMVNATEKFFADFAAEMNSMQMEMKNDEKLAASYMVGTQPIEDILNFCLDNFGQHPTKGGFNEDITLREYLFRKKKVFNDSIFQRRLAEIQTRNMKQR